MKPKFSAYQMMEKEHETGERKKYDTSKLEEHQHFHAKDKATLSLCYLVDCPLPPIINYSVDSLKREVELMTPKEYKLMCDKNFLKDFSIREKKIVLGNRYE